MVDTASFCGLADLRRAGETFHVRLKGRGLVVIGFPSNEFGEQEPGSTKEIADFCRLTYGIEFPMMAKTDIAAPKTHAFYKLLITRSGAAPKWNFHKYLIDRSGNTVVSFSTLTAPDSRTLIAQIERRLAEKP